MTQARLQFRWEATEQPADEFGYRDWICKYELSIPLNEYDIRREDENYQKVRDSQVVELGSTKRGSSKEPCVAEGGGYYFDAPYRDGSHATWDAEKLGNPPIVCIAIDGTIIPKPLTPSNQAPQPSLMGIIKNLVLACEANGLRGLPFVRDAREAIAGEPEPVLRVKPLKWTEDDIPKAEFAFGKYSIMKISHALGYELRLNGEQLGHQFSTLDHAKTVAQNDYQGRLLSALATSEGSADV